MLFFSLEIPRNGYATEETAQNTVAEYNYAPLY